MRTVLQIRQTTGRAVGPLSLLLLLALACPAPAALPKISYNPSYHEMLAFVTALARHDPYVSVASIGRSVRGRQIPVVIAHDPAVSPLEVTRLLVLCRQHGNEPAGTVAMLDLLRELGEGSAVLHEQLRRVCLLVVPMINPDGVEANTRSNANGADLNRDWADRRQPESQAVERLAALWRPTVVLDLHELPPNDPYGLNTVEAPAAGMTVETIYQECRDLQTRILQRLDGAGFPVRTSSWDSRNQMSLAHRHFIRAWGAVGLLFESERQGNARSLPRRAAMHKLGVQTALEYYWQDEFSRRYPRLAMAPAIAPPVVTDAGGGLGVNGAAYLGPAAAAPPTVEVVSPDLTQPLRGNVPVKVELTGVEDLQYLVVKIDGQGRFFANHSPYEFELKTATLTAGRHVVLVQAHRKDGSLVEREYLITVEAP